MSGRYEGPIIDAHHHLWDLSLGRHPWLTSYSEAVRALGDVSDLRRDYGIAEYLGDVGAEPVVGSVTVEAHWDRARPPTEEIAWLCGLPRPPGIAARAVGFAPLRDPGLAGILDGLAAFPAVVGVRETIRWHPDPAKRWTAPGIPDDPAWRRGVALLGRHGLLLELLMNPYQAEEVARLARDHPGQTIVVNHCGSPVDRDPEGRARWRTGLAAMGRCPNVAIKLSNFAAYGDGDDPAARRDIVMTCLDAFGPERALFATDYPVARRHAAFAALCEDCRAAVADLTPGEQREIFHDTAARLYGFSGS